MRFQLTESIEIERTRRRHQLMAAIAEFKAKPIDVVRNRSIRQLEDALSRLGGPIE